MARTGKHGRHCLGLMPPLSTHPPPPHQVLPTYGHVRDLPARSGSVDPSSGFEMRWETAPAAAPRLAAMANAAATADKVVLATDPDREGEAISWHVLEELRSRGAVTATTLVERAAFTSVTRDAVLSALASPRPLCDDLVRAYFARRALDYLYGFSVSPLLWRKLPGARSAGRVQSAALALVAQREAALRAFVRTPYWTVEAQLAVPGGRDGGAVLAASLRTLPGGGAVPAPGLPDAATADAATAELHAASMTVHTATSRDVARSPPPPFVTASLQQAASALLGCTPTETMALAQALYEGGDGAGGLPLITYMRTDGVSMQEDAVAAAREAAVAAHGAAAVPAAARTWRARTKNAQEAHEAIRPVDFKRPPSTLPPSVGPKHKALYDLIWRRTLASQMADARLKAVRVDVAASPCGALLRATATAVVAPGFAAAYSPSDIKSAARAARGVAAAAEDEESDGDGGGTPSADAAPLPGEDGALIPAAGGAAAALLASLAPGDPLDLLTVTPARRETRPPPRFSEATLVAALEAAGVGRPSTYAPTVRLLLDRGYVTKVSGRRLAASPRGAVLAAYLDTFFAAYVDASFTSSLETALDDVASGRASWSDVVASFWTPLDAAVSVAAGAGGGDVVDALDATLGEATVAAAARAAVGAAGTDAALANAVAAARTCPKCGGRMGLKLGSTGGFFGCGNYPTCTEARPLWPDGATPGDAPPPAGAADPRELGDDPSSGLPVSVRVGPYGPYVQLGPARESSGGGTCGAAGGAGTKDAKPARPPPPPPCVPAQGRRPSESDPAGCVGPAGLSARAGRAPLFERERGDRCWAVRPLRPRRGRRRRDTARAAAAGAGPRHRGVGGGGGRPGRARRARRRARGRARARGGGAKPAPARGAATKATAAPGNGAAGAAAPDTPPPAAAAGKKRPPSAYILFCASERSAVVADAPGAQAAAVIAELGARWRGLPAGDKAKWEAAAAEAKAAWVAGSGGGRAAPTPRASKKGAAAPAGEVGAPSTPIAKRPPSAYLLFCAAERPAVTAAEPGLAAPVVLQRLGERWRALTPEGKAPWEEKAKAAKEAAGGVGGGGGGGATQKASAPQKASSSAKRPPSPYLAFCAATRPAVVAALGPSVPPSAVMMELGRRWRELSEGEKAAFKQG